MLDLGCGGGLYTGELSRRGAVAVGVDLHRESLRKARGQQGEDNCYFVCADAKNLPFREGVFAMVVCVEVLTHIPPQPRAQVFAAVARVLKEGGRAYYTLHNRLRLTLSRWARLRRAQEVYPTINLDVWPLNPTQARAALTDCDMLLIAPVRYLNYHSRFSYSYYVSHPRMAQFVIAIEEVMCRLPVLKRLAITFLLVAEKASLSNGGGAEAE